ncbi:MAG: phage major capsid protein [Aeriscardovia sp.]|nr:phage major capsid protein [Aeriscardovia sp.]
MEIKEMQMSDIEQRSAEIEEMLKAEDADIDSLTAEVEQLEARKAEIETEVEKRKQEAEEALKIGNEIEKVEERRMTNMEVRNSKEYIDAFAEYIKSGNDTECRALLTENVNGGTVPVPELVYNIVKTAWDREGIMALVRKTSMKGNLKVGFEISADGAVVHTEGGDAITPENLVLGTVNIVPSSIKKVLQISDEVYDLRGEEFLNYVYDELAYRIAKKCADLIIVAIEACGTVSTTTSVGVPAITASTIAQATIASAMANLSDEASNPVVMMNKATWGAFKSAQYSGNFNADIFEGLPVLFNNTIKAFSVASTGDTYAIVGDLGHGALANYPNGQGIDFKFDDLSLKKQDLIEVLGREYVGLGIVAPNAFVKIKK